MFLCILFGVYLYPITGDTKRIRMIALEIITMFTFGYFTSTSISIMKVEGVFHKSTVVFI
ncbi:hypothetical protein HMPREF0758_4978 [Serratia odorifera DSM 4582]|uniref:Uncharacterized protein n=1 Tax=Serratia odorifera DSM 4582 TaxID=667129 RepID=D4E9X8_SEROD|nr:hypothetical protein HMPREF0758_4978 [Serratia odorifera DSM 4582]